MSGFMSLSRAMLLGFVRDRAALFFTDPLEGRRYVDVSENSCYWYFVVASWLPIDAVVYWGARVT